MIRTGAGNANAIALMNDRRALDDLRVQRRKLAVDLKARTGFDYCERTRLFSAVVLPLAFPVTN